MIGFDTDFVDKLFQTYFSYLSLPDKRFALILMCAPVCSSSMQVCMSAVSHRHNHKSSYLWMYLEVPWAGWMRICTDTQPKDFISASSLFFDYKCVSARWMFNEQELNKYIYLHSATHADQSVLLSGQAFRHTETHTHICIKFAESWNCFPRWLLHFLTPAVYKYSILGFLSPVLNTWVDVADSCWTLNSVLGANALCEMLNVIRLVKCY